MCESALAAADSDSDDVPGRKGSGCSTTYEVSVLYGLELKHFCMLDFARQCKEICKQQQSTLTGAELPGMAQCAKKCGCLYGLDEYNCDELDFNLNKDFDVPFSQVSRPY